MRPFVDLPGGHHANGLAIVRNATPGLLKRYSAEQVLRSPGSNANKLHVVLSGFAKTLGASDGGHDIIGFAMPGDVLGLGALAVCPAASDTVFLTDAVVAELPLEEAGPLDPAAGGGGAVSVLISRELSRTRWRNRFVRHACVKSRVAQFLLEMGRRFAEIDYPSHQFRLFMPRDDIAAFLCMTKCTLSRTLHTLRERGLIDIHARWIVIIDPVELGRV